MLDQIGFITNDNLNTGACWKSVYWNNWKIWYAIEESKSNTERYSKITEEGKKSHRQDTKSSTR